jgi:hypothetical protein
MLSSIENPRTAFNPNARGYHAVYHDGEVNHCPGCGRTHWIIGRLSAECAFCSTALPLKDTMTHGTGSAPVFRTRTPPLYADLAA